MKKFFYTLIAAMMAATSLMAQHAPMTFVGESKMSVMNSNIENDVDTIQFCTKGRDTGDIILPEMKGMSTIPSFTISNASFTMDENHVVTFPEQTFSADVEVDGSTKTVNGESLSGQYDMADNSLELKVVFKYGSMPFPVTYTIKSYYVKSVTNSIDVNVGGKFNYTCESATYKVRKYMKDDVQMLDVEVPTYSLAGTVMGDLTLGTYTVRGLLYDEEKDGFYRDYAGDALSFHFTAEQNGNVTMDGDYTFNAEKDNNILVQYSGGKVSSIINTFQMGAMPFGIVSSFSTDATGVVGVGQILPLDKNAYGLNGQRVPDGAHGIVIIGGKKYLKR